MLMNAWLNSPESDRNLRLHPIRDLRLQICESKVGVLTCLSIYLLHFILFGCKCGYELCNSEFYPRLNLIGRDAVHDFIQFINSKTCWQRPTWVSSEVVVQLRLATVVIPCCAASLFSLQETTCFHFDFEFKQCGQHNLSSKCHTSGCVLKEKSNIINADSCCIAPSDLHLLFSFKTSAAAWPKHKDFFIDLKFHSTQESFLLFRNRWTLDDKRCE